MKRILAIDDEPEITSWMGEIFSGEGVLVETVNDPEKAIRMGQETRYDVIISDICMPKVSGVEVVKSIRMGINAETPVIILSGSPDSETIHQVFQLNPFAHLDKPFELNVIIETVRQAVGELPFL